MTLFRWGLDIPIARKLKCWLFWGILKGTVIIVQRTIFYLFWRPRSKLVNKLDQGESIIIALWRKFSCLNIWFFSKKRNVSWFPYLLSLQEVYTCVNVWFCFQSLHTKVCMWNLDIPDKYYSSFPFLAVGRKITHSSRFEDLHIPVSG